MQTFDGDISRLLPRSVTFDGDISRLLPRSVRETDAPSADETGHPVRRVAGAAGRGHRGWARGGRWRLEEEELESHGDVTRILRSARTGDRGAVDRLVPLVYEELKGVARRRLRAEAAGTLDTTALVHETYLKLVDQTRVEWQDRAHFFAVAARAMRRILVDHARRRGRAKRGGGRRRVPLDATALSVEENPEALLELERALARLQGLNERLCRVVECRFFAGLTAEETAEALGISLRTVRRDWVKAKGFLYTHLEVA